MLALILVQARSVANEPADAKPAERINWGRVEYLDRRGKKKDTHSAAELTEFYFAALDRDETDDAFDIEALISRKPDIDVLAAATRMFGSDRDLPMRAAVALARGVLAKEARAVTYEECAPLEELAARILEREVAMPEGNVTGADERKQYAARILAALGTPRATELLVKLALVKSPYAHALRDMRHGDVPQLVLGLLDRRADHFTATPIAEALAGSAEGRAELRKLLDPKTPFGWKAHGPGKGAAFVALTSKFQELEDLVAIESALQQVPTMVDPLRTPLPYSKKTPEQAEAVVAFLTAHEGAKIEEALLLAVAMLPDALRDELFPKLVDARPDTRARVEAKRKAWDDARRAR